MSSHTVINFQDLTKKEKYDYFHQVWPSLWESTITNESNLCNVYALMRQVFGWWWVGNYWVKENELKLGVFQGDPACTTIDYGKGVCGTSWKNSTSIVVPNVHEFPGHIACSAQTNSEIVVPIFNSNSVVIGVLDVDSIKFGDFDEEDRTHLEIFCIKLADLL